MQIMSPEYIEYIIANYVKTPLMKSLKKIPLLTFYADEIQDITTIEQMAIYGSFEHNGEIHKHFIGLLPLSKLAGTSLCAENIMNVIETFFRNNAFRLKMLDLHAWIQQM